MQVIQVRLKLYLLRDIPAEKIQASVTSFLDKGFSVNEGLLELHEANHYKNYCYDLPYPIEEDKVYKKGKIYTLTVRTIDEQLAKYFSEVCVNTFTKEMKGLTAEVRLIPEKIIEYLYTLTPVVLKDEKGYWKDHMTLEKFEERLKVNLIKKWNCFSGEKSDEDFQLYTMLEFFNKGPISVEYKNIRLLGDKLRIMVADNPTAQKLAYMALGTGIGEMNGRGMGYVNYRWI